MINVNWEQKSEQRLLQPGDAVLSLDTRAEELGAPAGIFFQAEVLDTRPSSRNASLRFRTSPFARGPCNFCGSCAFFLLLCTICVSMGQRAPYPTEAIDE
jgi:hypothetical protein